MAPQTPHLPPDPGSHPPRQPGPGRTAELRRAFAEQARAERPDLALLCLLVAAQADGALDDAGVDAAQADLDRLAGELPYRPGGPREWAAALERLLGGHYDFRGSPADYRRLESSLLHAVLRRRRGLPIMLAVVWIEVARRAGAPVYGVALPGHFVVGLGPYGHRVTDAPADEAAGSGAHLAGQVLVDPFDGGRVLGQDDARRLVAATAGASLEASMLVPARPLDVVARILGNIRTWAAARPEQSEVALWAVDLQLLLPAHPARLRRERAEILVQRGDYLTGAAELEAYAEVVAAVDERAADLLRRRARAARARLN
jgi:regulator of sirC expression with transglutaminase-like and TPR domain